MAPMYPEGSLIDLDICDKYQGFVTSFYNGVYGEFLVLIKIK